MNFALKLAKSLPEEATSSSSRSKYQSFEAMESRILAFLERNGVQIEIPSEYLKRIHLERMETAKKTRETVKKISLSCPLFIKRKSKIFLKE